MINYKLSQFTKLEDTIEYDSILFALKPRNEFAGKKMNVNDMAYIDTRFCLSLMRKIQAWDDFRKLFCYSFGCTETEFNNENIVNFYHALNYLKIEWQRVVEVESKILKSQIVDDNQAKWQIAGIKNLDPFVDIINLDELGERYGVYPFDLGRKPYSEILSLIVMLKRKNEIYDRFSKLNK
jgi:hypothetical protein